MSKEREAVVWEAAQEAVLDTISDDTTSDGCNPITFEQWLAANPEPTCKRIVDDDGNWDTACGDKHILLEGGPKENRMAYCCYCGKRIEVKE